MIEILRYSIEQVTFFKQDECLKFIGMFLDKVRNLADDEKSAIYYAKQILKEKLIPHIGTDEESFSRKAYFLGYMTRKLLYGFLGKTDEDDRDHYGKKRLDMTGVLMTNLFKDQFKNSYIENAKKLISRKVHTNRSEI